MAESSKNLYLPLPEVEFPADELRDWGYRNRHLFRYARENQGGLFGCIIPHSFTKILNDQVALDYNVYNAGVPLFRLGHLYLLEETYPMHIDPRRDASLNYELDGKSATMWEDGTVCPYKPGEAMLFNTQVPHAVFPKTQMRMAVSFTVTMGFPRFVNLHSEGLIFTPRDRMLHMAEVMGS